MSKFENLKSTISSVLMRTEVYQHGSSLVPKPNEKELTARLKPEQQGFERGKEDLPPSSATQFDEVETKIIDTMQEMVDDTTKDVNEALNTYNDRLSSLSMAGKLDEIRNTCQRGISDFLKEIAEGRNYLYSHAEDVRNRDSDLLEFRREHRLRRTASYPEGGSKIFKIGIIIFLFAMEFVGNSVFLSKSNEMGVVGASTEAIYISVINIVSALLVGILVTRFMYHRSVLLKTLSVTFTTLCLAGAVFFNLLVAHYREVSGSGLFGEAGQVAIKAMRTDPFGLDSIAGWMLFIVGLLFWFIAVIDAHGLDDHYPGYGAVYRRARKTRKDYSRQLGEIIQELTDKRENGEQEITDIRNDLDAVLAKIGTLKNARGALLSDYELFKSQMEKVCIRIVEKYRSANRSVRSEVPVSFDLTPTLVFSNNFGALNSSFNADDELESVRSARALLDESIMEFYSEFRDKIESLDPLDKVLDEGRR